MAQERARLARGQAEAEAAIAADNRAFQPTQTATATTDEPCMLNLQATPAMSTLPAAEAMRNHDTCAKLGGQGKGLIQVAKSCSEETVSLQYGENGNMVVSMPVPKACYVRVRAVAK